MEGRTPRTSNSAIEQIAAAIAHEVKNPITLVKANIDLLEANDISQAHRKNYELMRTELDRINDIMMDFICLTKPAADEKDIVYPYDLLAAAKAKYETAHGGDIHIDLVWQNKDLTILGNEKNLEILFNNIIKNGVEAMEGRGEIHIEGALKENTLVIEIGDQGPGLPEDIQGQVFDQFFTTKTAGSGLGLSICAKIAEEHEGGFALGNRGDGETGCIATITIPVYKEQG